MLTTLDQSRQESRCFLTPNLERAAGERGLACVREATFRTPSGIPVIDVIRVGPGR